MLDLPKFLDQMAMEGEREREREKGHKSKLMNISTINPIIITYL